MDPNIDGEITLAFSLSALERLDRPERVFDEAREWSKYVGVVSDSPQHRVKKYTRDHELPTHFLSRPNGEKRRTLEDVKSVSSEYEGSDRYVFVGTSGKDERIAEETEWEYLSVEDAAEAADWTVSSSVGEPDPEPTGREDKRDDWP